MRNLLLFLLLLLAIFWIRKALTGKTRSSEERAAGPVSGAAADAGEPERVLACERCGVHVPESEGIVVAGHFYCCDEHRQ